MTVTYHATWEEIGGLVERLAYDVDGLYQGVWGIPRGGCVPAAMLAGRLGLPLVHAPAANILIVDDLIDSGATRARWDGHPFAALYRKSWSPPCHAMMEVPGDHWIVFPWEVEEAGPEDAVIRLLSFVGEDPNRDGLAATPGRVIRSLAELTSGYGEDPAEILAVTFAEACDEMIVLRGVSFTSLCEHHLLAFTGTATLGYVPGAGRVVGLSKLARLVDCYARRLQIQERLTTQIADALVTHLAPTGAGVVILAEHSCMGCRGVRKPGAEMVTSALHGAFREIPEARAEFLALTRG